MKLQALSNIKKKTLWQTSKRNLTLVNNNQLFKRILRRRKKPAAIYPFPNKNSKKSVTVSSWLYLLLKIDQRWGYSMFYVSIFFFNLSLYSFDDAQCCFLGILPNSLRCLILSQNVGSWSPVRLKVVCWDLRQDFFRPANGVPLKLRTNHLLQAKHGLCHYTLQGWILVERTCE